MFQEKVHMQIFKISRFLTQSGTSYLNVNLIVSTYGANDAIYIGWHLLMHSDEHTEVGFICYS